MKQFIVFGGFLLYLFFSGSVSAVTSYRVLTATAARNNATGADMYRGDEIAPGQLIDVDTDGRLLIQVTRKVQVLARGPAQLAIMPFANRQKVQVSYGAVTAKYDEHIKPGNWRDATVSLASLTRDVVLVPKKIILKPLNLKKLPPVRFYVQTPTMVAGVRGSIIRTVDQGIDVLEGHATVKDGNKQVTVGPFHRVEMKDGHLEQDTLSEDELIEAMLKTREILNRGNVVEILRQAQSVYPRLLRRLHQRLNILEARQDALYTFVMKNVNLALTLKGIETTICV